MEYVSEKYLPKSDVFFNLSLAEKIHNFCKEDESLHDPHIRILSYHHLWMANARSDEEKDRLLALAAQHPNKIRGEFLAKAVMGKITPEEISLANAALLNALADMEKKLEEISSDFIFGEKYSMADAACTVRLFRFGRLNLKIELLKDQYPLTANFYERMKERPSFDELRI
jgi:glutathione S-transferase